MPIPTVEEMGIYKSPDLRSQVRVAVALEYPVFSGSIRDDFDDGSLDSTKWDSFAPSWAAITEAGSTVKCEVTDPAGVIATAWFQSKPNLWFPVWTDTDWTFETRCHFPVTTGFGTWLTLCTRSSRDVGSVWAVKADLAGGAPGHTAQLRIHMPYSGYDDPLNSVVWEEADPTVWHVYKVAYHAEAQTYEWFVDGVSGGTIPVAGRYVEAVVVGNSVAIQGNLMAWTSIEVDYISVDGTAEAIELPVWANPFTYEGALYSYLPTMISGHITVDKDNTVDAAEIVLDNFSRDELLRERTRTYTWTRFVNRRAIIEARAGDAFRWLPWVTLFDGKCGEKRFSLTPQGDCKLTLPMRDRRRAEADDNEVMGAYSDNAVAIPGVGMNMSVDQIVADLFTKAGLEATHYNIVSVPSNVPREYNVFRTSAIQAARALCEEAALTIWQRISDARIEVREWSWGTGTPDYWMHSGADIDNLDWDESALDATVQEELAFESADPTIEGWGTAWPPHRYPFHGRIVHSNSVAAQDSVAHDARPFVILMWWIRNRKVGSVKVQSRSQLWVEHDLEIGVIDDMFLGLGRGESYIIDGWEHSWQGQGNIQTGLRLINTRPDRLLRATLI